MSKVLLAHDNPDQRQSIRTAIRDAGFSEIVEADDGSSALEAIEAQPFAVAVIDISLMHTRRETRRFVPTADGLPLRIAPTTFAPTPDDETTEGLNVIERLRRRQPTCRILGLTTKFRDVGAEVLDRGGDDFIFTEWASIDYLELLRKKLMTWRTARPRTPLPV